MSKEQFCSSPSSPLTSVSAGGTSPPISRQCGRLPVTILCLCTAFKVLSLTVMTLLISCTSCYHQAVCFQKCKFLDPVLPSAIQVISIIYKNTYSACVCVYIHINLKTTAPSQRLILCEKLSHLHTTSPGLTSQ